MACAQLQAVASFCVSSGSPKPWKVTWCMNWVWLEIFVEERRDNWCFIVFYLWLGWLLFKGRIEAGSLCSFADIDSWSVCDFVTLLLVPFVGLVHGFTGLFGKCKDFSLVDLFYEIIVNNTCFLLNDILAVLLNLFCDFLLLISSESTIFTNLTANLAGRLYLQLCSVL